MKQIVLYGRLRKEFGGPFMMAVDTPAEAVRALEANFPGRFMSSLRQGSYRVGRAVDDPGIDAERLTMKTSAPQIHFEPVVEGAGGRRGKGIITVVLGISLIAAAVIAAPAAGAGAAGFLGADLGATAFTIFGSSVSYGNIALLGLSLALQGLSSFISPVPKVSTATVVNNERPEERPSALFQGPINTTEQGGPVPLIYGRIRAGSVVISAGLTTEKVPV